MNGDCACDAPILIDNWDNSSIFSISAGLIVEMHLLFTKV